MQKSKVQSVGLQTLSIVENRFKRRLLTLLAFTLISFLVSGRAYADGDVGPFAAGSRQLSIG